MFVNIFPLQKYLKDDKHNSLHLAQKYGYMFVPDHYVFLKIQSLTRDSLSEKLFAPRNRQRPRTSIRAFFLAKWMRH